MFSFLLIWWFLFWNGWKGKLVLPPFPFSPLSSPSIPAQSWSAAGPRSPCMRLLHRLPLSLPVASPWDHQSSICIKQANKGAKETSPAEILWLLISKNINSSPLIQNEVSSHGHGRWAHPWCVDLSPLSGCLSSFHGFKSLLRAYDSALEASCWVLSLRSSLFIFICPPDISTWVSKDPAQNSSKALPTNSSHPQYFHPRYWKLEHKKPRVTFDRHVSLTLCV